MEDHQHAIKAEERRRRMAYMLASSRAGDPGTESSSSSSASSRSSNRQTDAVKKVPSPATPVYFKPPSFQPNEKGSSDVPTELSDLEIKASVRQAHVTRLLEGQHPNNSHADMEAGGSNSFDSPKTPAVLLDLEIKTQARQGHVARLLQQRAGVARTAGTASQALTDLERKAITRPGSAFLGGALEQEATRSHRGDIVLGALSDMEHKASARQGIASRLLRTTHGGSAVPSPVPADTDAAMILHTKQLQEEPDLEEPTMMMSLPGAFAYQEHRSSKEIKAVLVPDEDRQQILQEARAELLSAAVVASVTDESKKSAQHRRQQWVGIGLVCCLFLVGVGAIVGVVCGSTSACGGETPSAQRASSVERIVQVTELIQSVSLNSQALLSNGGSNGADGELEEVSGSASSEFEALSFLLESDLSPVEDAPRLVQQYSLAVLWFATGPWSLSDRKQGDNANPRRSWFVDANECQWVGVTCNEDGIATSIGLSHQNMRGTLPIDLVLLSELTSLSVPGNALTGTIPSFLTEFSRLAHLDLSDNSFIGPILPAFFSSFPALTEYLATSNDFTGSFPSDNSIGSQLQKLAVDFNELTGTLPSTLSDWTQLTHLGMVGNQLSGALSNLGTLTDLRHLTAGLSGGSLGGLSPLAELRQLTHLSLDSTSLEGSTLPDAIGDWWPNMQVFSVLRANLEGSIPQSIEHWTDMKHFALGNNQLTGQVPEGIYTGWSNLESFTLGWNDIRDSIPSEIGALTKLEAFDIRHNRFTGTLPTTIGLLTNLGKLVLTSNRLSGEIPVEILSIKDDEVWFDSNRFVGTAPYCTEDSEKLIAVRVDCAAVECPCCSGC